MPNTFGHIFRVSSFGESHGPGIGVIIDGCPAGFQIDLEGIQTFLDRRRPGQSPWTSPRKEPDRVTCLSGLEGGRSLGSPLTLFVRNEDARPSDYNTLNGLYRPSHADYTNHVKYGIRSQTGGGRSSARETIARVAAAGVAEQILSQIYPDLRTLAYVYSMKDIQAEEPLSFSDVSRKNIDELSPFRTIDSLVIPKMENLLQEAKTRGDSVGGVIRARIENCPPGLGEPVFDKLHADLAKAMLSLPAARGFEIGSGFYSTQLWGSEHNDPFVSLDGKIRTSTNHSGGVQGGISNGETIWFSVAFKPVSTLAIKQLTVDESGVEQTLEVKGGRHDPCVLPRAVPLVEAMSSLVIMDHVLRQRTARRESGGNSSEEGQLVPPKIKLIP
ncbi:MAG: chorismate synthase [Oligoflexales bacterium]|nr:chorismate synthase [Oligoflexales bacterium]